MTEQITVNQLLWTGGVLMVAFLILKELVAVGTRYFFKRGFETDYVTVTQCTSNRAACSAARTEGATHRDKDILALKRAISLMIEYNKDIPLEKRAEIRDGLIT